MKRHVFAPAAVLAICITGLAYGDPPPVKPSPSTPVTVVNTPLPVTVPGGVSITGGSVTVTNTTANPVPISGNVSVGNLPATQQVSGTVNVGNLPAVQQVSVTNASSAPVFVRVLNAPGSSPFVGVLNPANPTFQVPSTINGESVQSLVVTQVSGGCTGIGSFLLPLQDAVGGGVIASYIFPVLGLEGPSFFPILTQQTQIYFATGHSVVLSDAVPPHGCEFDLSGYFVTQ